MKKIEITARIPLLTDRLTNNNADSAGRVVGEGGMTIEGGRSKDRDCRGSFRVLAMTE